MGHVFPWSLSVVGDAIRGVVRHRRLNPRLAEAWSDAAWTYVVDHAASLDAHYRRESSERTFIGSVLDHHCVSWLRRRSTEPKTFSFEGKRTVADRVADPQWVDPMLAAEAAAQHAELTRSVVRAMAMLPQAERTIVDLSVVQGLKMPRVAAELGCSATAGYKRLRRALVKLRRLMAEQASQPDQDSERR